MEAVLQRCRVLSPVIMPVPPCPNYLGKTLISKGYVGKMLRTAIQKQLIFETAISVEPLGGMSFQK